MRIPLALALSDDQEMGISAEGGMSVGTRCDSHEGNVAVWGARGRTRWARVSNGRCVLILVFVVAFRGRGPVSGFFHLRGLSVLGSLNEYREGKSEGSHAVTGHIGEGGHASVTTAIPLLYARRRSIGGRAASTARMLTGVDEKQLVTQHWTLCQKRSSFWVIALLGVKMSAP